ncbi:MAG: hypothetical protein IJ506_04365 [Clostridia bacterium]|nr:hypothetical protein [Clostridia bacterium]
MKTKKFTSVLLAAFLAASVGAAAGCDEETSKISVQSELFMPVSDSKLPLYSEYVLEKADESLDEIVWKSSNESVLEVSDGELFAKKTGTATVTATWNGEKQTQKITVFDDGARPVIQADDLPLILGSTFEAKPELSFNGVEYEGATFTFTSDSACVAVEGAKLTANALGSANISVSASYRGVENIASGSFACTVNANEGIVPSRARYDLFATAEVNGKSFETSVTLAADAYLGETIEKNAGIVWTVADPAVAELTDGKTLTAKALGETTLTGVYEKDGKTLKTLEIPVTVNPSVVSTQKNLTIDKSKTIASFDPLSVYGKEAVLGSMQVNDVSYGMETNGVTTDNFKTGEYRAAFYSENGLFGAEVNLVVADFVVYTVDDLRVMDDYADGYIALGADIPEVGVYKPKNGTSSSFTGTFNGLGHNISGMRITTGNIGLFAHASNCTFKNVSITDVTLEKGDGSGVLYYRSTSAITIDNVYIEMSYKSSYTSSYSGGVLAFIFSGTVTMSNSIVVADCSNANATNGAILGRSNGGSLIMENSYVITDGTVCGTGNHSNNSNYATHNNLPVVYATAEDFAKMRYEDDSSIDLSGFASFWELNSSVPKF